MTHQPQTTQAHHKRVLCTLQGRFHLDMMLPSFVTGLYLRKSAYLEKWLSRHSYVPLGIFIVMLLIKIAILHTTPYPFKLVLGLTGAISCFVLFKLVLENISPTTTTGQWRARR